MKRKLDKHGLNLNRVRQSVAYINRAREKYPEDQCRLYYDMSLKYVLPVDRNTPASLYENKNKVFLCCQSFTENVNLQQLYDLVYKHWHVVEAYKAKKNLAKSTHPKRHTLLATEEEWQFLQEQLLLFRKNKA